jgi:predicted DCC family thiol-disulfide oxidoreductase YuxK
MKKNFRSAINTIPHSELTIFYDANCPLCMAEINFLSHHNCYGLLKFISLNDKQLCKDIDCDLALKTIHARLDKQIIVGARVFFEAYQRTNLRWIKFLLSFSAVQFIYSKGYIFFAKHRTLISKLTGKILLALVNRMYSNKQ